MKTCPFCAEEIQDAAIVCKHCGRDLKPAATIQPPAPPVPPPPPPAPRSTTTRSLAFVAALLGFLLSLTPLGAGIGIFMVWFGLAFGLQGSVFLRWIGGLIAAFVLVAIASALGRSATSTTTSSVSTPPSSNVSSSPSPTTASPSAPAVPPEPQYDLALLSAKGYESEYGGYHYVEGQVKNVSNQPLKSVMAVATWLDKDGNFIKSDDALIDYNPILPGQTSPFKTITTGNPAMAKFRVEFKRMFGGTLSVDDQRKKK